MIEVVCLFLIVFLLCLNKYWKLKKENEKYKIKIREEVLLICKTRNNLDQPPKQ